MGLLLATASLKSHKSVNSSGVGTVSVTCSLGFWLAVPLPANVL